MIHIWYSNISSFNINNVNIDEVTEERLEKISKIAFYEDKVLSLASFLLLKKMVTELNINTSLNFVYNSFDKPYFSDNDQYYFNISHSKDMVSCALSDHEIGIDIQYMKTLPTKQFELLKKKVITADDLLKIGESISLNDFYKYWVIKESTVKLMGLGLYENINHIDINFDKRESILKEKKAYYNLYNINQNYLLSIASYIHDKIVIKEVIL